MTFLFVILGFALINVAIPYGMWGYGARYLDMNEREFFTRYRLVSLPRAFCAVIVSLMVAAEAALPEQRNWLGAMAIVLTAVFGGLAVIDAWKATKGSWMNSKSNVGRIQ